MSPTGEAGALAAAVAPVARRGRRKREDAPAPTRAQVIDAVLAIAEQQGEAGLSMRNLAASLGVSAKLLYRHIQSKEELFALAGDAILQRWSIPSSELAWQVRLTELTLTGRKLVQRFPGLAQRPLLRSLQPQYSLQATRVIGAIRSCLVEAGLQDQHIPKLLIVYEALLLGELMLCTPLLRNLADGEEPTISRQDIDEGFQAGLIFLIAGIEAVSARQRQSTVVSSKR